MTEINNFQDFVHKNFEVIKFNKDTINQVIKDIKRVVDKYKEFQNGIYHYQEILELFQKVRNLAGKFCFSEFNTKVELICEYNL
jgi:translation elongation factor EF-Ts